MQFSSANMPSRTRMKLASAQSPGAKAARRVSPAAETLTRHSACTHVGHWCQLEVKADAGVLAAQPVICPARGLDIRLAGVQDTHRARRGYGPLSETGKPACQHARIWRTRHQRQCSDERRTPDHSVPHLMPSRLCRQLRNAPGRRLLPVLPEVKQGSEQGLLFDCRKARSDRRTVQPLPMALAYPTWQRARRRCGPGSARLRASCERRSLNSPRTCLIQLRSYPTRSSAHRTLAMRSSLPPKRRRSSPRQMLCANAWPCCDRAWQPSAQAEGVRMERVLLVDTAHQELTHVCDILVFCFTGTRQRIRAWWVTRTM